MANVVLGSSVDVDEIEDDDVTECDSEGSVEETLDDLDNNFDQEEVIHIPDTTKDVDKHPKGQVGFDLEGNMFQREKGDSWSRLTGYHGGATCVIVANCEQDLLSGIMQSAMSLWRKQTQKKFTVKILTT